MKKALAAMCLAALLLCSCGADIETAEDSFIVSVANEASDDIYGIHLEYTLDGELLGDMGARYADKSAIKTGDTLDFDFSADIFPENADLSDFSAELYVICAGGSERPCGRLSLAAAYGEKYSYTLTGGLGGFGLHEAR